MQTPHRKAPGTGYLFILISLIIVFFSIFFDNIFSFSIVFGIHGITARGSQILISANSVLQLHVPPVPLWIFYRYSGFPPQYNDMHMGERWIGEPKMTFCVNNSVNDGLMCHPAMSWRLVQVVPHVSRQGSGVRHMMDEWMGGWIYLFPMTIFIFGTFLDR